MVVAEARSGSSRRPERALRALARRACRTAPRPSALLASVSRDADLVVLDDGLARMASAHLAELRCRSSADTPSSRSISTSLPMRTSRTPGKPIVASARRTASPCGSRTSGLSRTNTVPSRPSSHPHPQTATEFNHPRAARAPLPGGRGRPASTAPGGVIRCHRDVRRPLASSRPRPISGRGPLQDRDAGRRALSSPQAGARDRAHRARVQRQASQRARPAPPRRTRAAVNEPSDAQRSSTSMGIREDGAPYRRARARSKRAARPAAPRRRSTKVAPRSSALRFRCAGQPSGPRGPARAAAGASTRARWSARVRAGCGRPRATRRTRCRPSAPALLAKLDKLRAR